MATTTTLMPSPSLKSAFSPYTESPSSPQYSLSYRVGSMPSHNTNAAQSESLAPPPSPYPATVDPSPVESTNSTSTDATDIEVDELHAHADDLKSPDIAVRSPQRGFEGLPYPRLDTDAGIAAADTDDGPQSVIHAPKGFKQFNPLPTHAEVPSPQNKEPGTNVGGIQNAMSQRRGSPSGQSERTVGTTEGPIMDHKQNAVSINTHVPPVKPGAGSTPKAATREEADSELRRKSSVRSTKTQEAISDNEFSGLGAALQKANSSDKEVASLKAALSECWNLCNSLATLSASHRERMFNFTGSGEIQEQAWRSCWKLCQKLYESRDDDHNAQIKPTLELCRDFCQALFECRDRGDEIKDSVLRVSFELNNHLYNTQAANPSIAVTERTLDFYLTICHRLMKDQTSLPDETDHLLRACWGLAESLFTLRQKNKDQVDEDEELWSSAVESCLELCDLFREGWTQLRPDRGTPRALQRGFVAGGHYSGSNYGNQSTYQPSHQGSRPQSAMSFDSNFRDRQFRNVVPETPTTIFDDRDDLASPGPPMTPGLPYISVMSVDHSTTLQNRQAAASGIPGASSATKRWSSNNSVSGYSESGASGRTASTRTTRAGIESSQTSPRSVTSSSADPSDDPNIVRIKALILKVAMNKGFQRSTSAATGNSSSPTSTLQGYVRTLQPTAFGTSARQIQLFDQYRRLVLNDAVLQDPQSFPRGRRFTPAEIAKAVRRLARSDQYRWLPGLYAMVFGFDPDDSSVNKAPGLQV